MIFDFNGRPKYNNDLIATDSGFYRLVTVMCAALVVIMFIISFYNINDGFFAQAFEFKNITVGFRATVNTVDKPE